jgi:hypothetical protein
LVYGTPIDIGENPESKEGSIPREDFTIGDDDLLFLRAVP